MQTVITPSGFSVDCMKWIVYKECCKLRMKTFSKNLKMPQVIPVTS